MKARIFIALGLTAAVFSSAFANEPVLSVITQVESGDRATMSRAQLRQGGGPVEIAFVEGETPVVGLQFDMKVRNAGAAADACGALPSGHSLTCNALGKDTLRVIVFSGKNAPIETGVLLTIPNAGEASIIEKSVQMGDANAQAVKAEIL